MGMVGMVVNYFLLMRPLLEQAQQMHGPAAAAAIGGAVGGTIGGCFGLIYPILLLVFMTRTNRWPQPFVLQTASNENGFGEAQKP